MAEVLLYNPHFTTEEIETQAKSREDATSLYEAD